MGAGGPRDVVCRTAGVFFSVLLFVEICLFLYKSNLSVMSVST